MSILLRLEEWLDAARSAEHPDIDQLITASEFFVQAIANRVAEHCGVVAGNAEWGSSDESGILCALRPLHPEQELPAAFIGLDDGGFDEDEWAMPRGYTYSRDAFHPVDTTDGDAH